MEKWYAMLNNGQVIEVIMDVQSRSVVTIVNGKQELVGYYVNGDDNIYIKDNYGRVVTTGHRLLTEQEVEALINKLRQQQQQQQQANNMNNIGAVNNQPAIQSIGQTIDINDNQQQQT